MKIDNEMYNETLEEEVTATDVTRIKLNENVVSSNIYDWVNSIIVAVVAVVVLLTFCFRLIDVDGQSMEPTLINTDKVIVTNLFYTPENGDVVVISHAEHYDDPLVKRVIATEGQTLKIDFATNEVFVNGELIEENYIQGTTIEGDTEIPEVIPEGKVFVMGDNRSNSLDSRYEKIGLVDEDSIIGKAQFVIIPHTYKEGSMKPVFDITKIRYIY